MFTGPPTNNADHVRMLIADQTIRTEAVIGAFHAVDRGFFVDPANEGPEGEVRELRYFNSPYLKGVQHLSAPVIYGTALEALELGPGLSFLNVCSGTGYLSALAAQIIGSKAVHCAIELRAALVAHARNKHHLLGLDGIDLRHGSCLALDPLTSMRFDRIYLGAGAEESMAVLLVHMLELGGVLVGPFACADRSQRLLRVERLGETAFQARELMHVHFTPLLPTPSEQEAEGEGAADGLSDPTGAATHLATSTTASPATAHAASPQQAPPSSSSSAASPAPSAACRRPRPTSISFEPPGWSVTSHERFPAAHRAAVRAVLLVHQRSSSLLSCLPKEVVLQQLLPKLAYSAFRPQFSVPADVPDAMPDAAHGRPLVAASFTPPTSALSTAYAIDDDGDSDVSDGSDDGDDDSDDGSDDDSDDGEEHHMGMDIDASAPLVVQ